MKLTNKDIKVLSVTVTLILGSVIWSFGVKPIIEKYSELNENLEKQISKYEENIELLNRRSEIEASYRKVEATFPASDERKPSDAFIEDVEAATKEILPDQHPPIFDPVQWKEIKGVNDYAQLELNMKTSGQLAGLSQLLKSFDQKGFLIAQLRLSQPYGIDSPELSMDIQLLRIVKINEDEESTNESSRKRTGSLGGYR